MKYLKSGRSRTFLLIALAMFGAVIACNLPSLSGQRAGLSQEEALQLVLEEIVKPDQLGDDPLIVFGWPEELVPGDTLHPYNIYGEDPVPGLVMVEAESWFFWIEDEPLAGFRHLTRYVLVDINSGQLSTSEEGWWPVLNGQGLWTDDEEYQNEENWAWSNVSFKESESSSSNGSSNVLAALHPLGSGLFQADSGKRRALVINTITEEESGEDDGRADVKNMLRFLDTYDFESTYLGPEHDKNPRRIRDPFVKGPDLDHYRVWLRNQAKEMNPGDTLVVYITGHGDGNFVIGENGGILNKFLRDELKEFKKCVDIIVIVSACDSGSFVEPLKDVADLTMTATDASSATYFDMDTLLMVFGGLMAIDLNPFDEGGEYTSSLIEGWEDILEDPAKMEKVNQRVKNEGITFMQALLSESYREGKIYDLGARYFSSPQESFGSPKTDCTDPSGLDVPPTPTFTPTPTPTPLLTHTPTSTPTPTPTPTQKFVSTLDYLGDYLSSMIVEEDVDHHEEHINMADQILLNFTNGSIRIQGPFPWVTVTGEISQEGIFDASGWGTVAGYSNIKVTFQGSISNGHLEGSYTMGANGGLPGGKPIIYGVNGDRLEPTPTPTPDPRIGELQEFFNDYNALFQAADANGLLGLLHPAVLDLYGISACQAYLTTAVKKPIEIEVLQVLSFESWTWEIDGHSILIEDAYSIQVGVSAGGQTIQQSMHLALDENGEITWFTDCGEPLP
jgi:hypothetical protein